MTRSDVCAPLPSRLMVAALDEPRLVFRCPASVGRLVCNFRIKGFLDPDVVKPQQSRNGRQQSRGKQENEESTKREKKARNAKENKQR